MPRQARIDAPGALHHIIIRGIEKRAIFQDDQDRDNFLERLGRILTETSTPCYAWTLMYNHVHLLLRTGVVPIATVMRRLLTGYAQQFNRRHNRHGQLFQNRYKSFLCEEDPYLLELVRYIHLNPLRAGIVKELKELNSYHYSGHAVLMGTAKHSWHDIDYVLRYFGPTKRRARKEYTSFVAEGIEQGRRPDLVGGGLLRSVGGWSSLKANRRKGIRIKGDERILGSSEFVEEVLKVANEELERRTRFQSQGLNYDALVSRVANYYGIELNKLMTKSKVPAITRARSVLCYLAVRKLGLNGNEVALKLNISPSAVSKATRRGESTLPETEIEKILQES
ncbi:MAG: transposase [Syntrophobacterales bacterium]|jgi:REP element-mobilizing transposase RayT